MKTHINSVHNGQKDHKCVTCGKAFSSAQNLKTHIISVHGQKDLKCDICGKSFSLGKNLNRHMIAVHNGQKNINNL